MSESPSDSRSTTVACWQARFHAEAGHGHGHSHYAVVSDPVREGGEPVRALIHGAERITVIEDAAGDPAAIE